MDTIEFFFRIDDLRLQDLNFFTECIQIYCCFYIIFPIPGNITGKVSKYINI